MSRRQVLEVRASRTALPAADVVSGAPLARVEECARRGRSRARAMRSTSTEPTMPRHPMIPTFLIIIALNRRILF